MLEMIMKTGHLLQLTALCVWELARTNVSSLESYISEMDVCFCFVCERDKISGNCKLLFSVFIIHIYIRIRISIE